MTRARVLPPVHPNVGVESVYRRQLQNLIEQMHRSLLYWIKAAYRANSPAILALDRSPAAEIDAAFKKQARRWQSRFNTASNKLAREFAKDAQDRSDAALRKVYRASGISVRFGLTPAARDGLAAVTAENVGLIRSIASEHLQDVQGLVMRSAARGRDLGELTKQLQQRYALSHDRAAFIARDQNNKATAIITLVRQREAGIKQARWQHSAGGRKPRVSHVKASRDGLVYNVDEGAFIDGQWIYPGELPNCRCVSRPIIFAR